MQRPILWRLAWVTLIVGLLALAFERDFAQSDSASVQATALNQGQLDQLVAPIALYPDPLLADVLIASSYPLEVVVAARWVEENKSLSGTALSNVAGRQSWDYSVKTLAHAPAVLTMMSAQIDWTNKLGEAFIAQQAGVMDAVQRLRKRALAAGKLNSSPQQTVTVEGDTIYIEPAETAMYVPYYDPMDVYRSWAWDDYPPYYWPAPSGYGFLHGFFTAAIIAGIWNGYIDYPSHRLTIDNRVERFARRGSQGSEVWRHNPQHRQGVDYARPDLQKQFGKGNLPGSAARRDFRGFEQNKGELTEHKMDRPSSATGKQELLNPLIGRNETAAIQACLAYVDAQRDFAARTRNGGGAPHYAMRIISSPGNHDGLFWPTDNGETASPLGPLFARAQSEGYMAPKAQREPSPPTPYHGYVYKILTAQGPAANGGALDYVVNGKMIGGFALVASPATYGMSAVMTFIVNHEGKVFQKDLGPGTARFAAAMTAFNPDQSWSAAQ